MTEFETLLEPCQGAVERFVKYRVPSLQDAEDILQEVYLTAFQKLHTLRDREQFKAWILTIARNKCNDFFRQANKVEEVPLETVAGTLAASRMGPVESTAETLSVLPPKDAELMKLFYVYGYSQTEIGEQLGIPVGTVKSRLHTARSRLRAVYDPKEKPRKVVEKMKFPKIMPDYTITKLNKAPFPVKWEEMMGWFTVPRLGEKLSWAMYDFPSKQRGEYVDMQVLGKAQVHGIEGVEIEAKEYQPMECNRIDDSKFARRTFVAQLTDTHCRILAESHVEDGVKKFFTFLDGDDFLPNWGFGKDNCGNEVSIGPRGDVTREGDTVTAAFKPYLLDVVGRYEVTIGGKTYDTICVMDIENYSDGVASEQYLDQNGRTVLWRRFNRNNWAYGRYGKLWTEALPENERITVNGETYVHWYDCITDYILK